MSFTATLKEDISLGGATFSQQTTDSADAIDSRDLTIPDSTTDQLVTIAIDVSLIKLLYIVSDQAVTIETNDGSAPDDTLAMLADHPLIWRAGDYYANKLTADVTAMYITNSSGATATVRIRVLQDSTP